MRNDIKTRDTHGSYQRPNQLNAPTSHDPNAFDATNSLGSGKFIPLRSSQNPNFPTHPPSHTLDYNMRGEMNRQASCNTNIDPDADDLLEFSQSNLDNQTAQRRDISNVTND